SRCPRPRDGRGASGETAPIRRAAHRSATDRRRARSRSTRHRGETRGGSTSAASRSKRCHRHRGAESTWCPCLSLQRRLDPAEFDMCKKARAYTDIQTIAGSPRGGAAYNRRMLARGLAIAALTAACFRPAVHPGAPCSSDGSCPNGLECRSDLCVEPGGNEPDAAGDALADTAIDAAIDGGPAAWSAPTPVPGVDSTDVEDDPSFTANRLTMVFTSTRAGGLGMEDLYIGTRATTADPFTVAPLTALSSTAREQSPEISADGKTLYFTSTRSGANVVYKSTLVTGGWSPPAAVPELAAINGDDVAISPDGLSALGI